MGQGAASLGMSRVNVATGSVRDGGEAVDPARLYVLLCGIIATAALVTLSAGAFHFRVDPGFYGFLGIVVTFIGTIIVKTNPPEDD